MSHISKGAGRGEEVFHRIQCCEGSNPSNEERKHIRHFAGSWGEAEVTDVRQHNSEDSNPPPQKKTTNTLFAAKNRRFFPNSSSHFDLFPSTSFPLSSLFLSVSSFCFVLVLPLFPFFCGEQEEGIDCVDLFCCLNYTQPSEKN